MERAGTHLRPPSWVRLDPGEAAPKCELVGLRARKVLLDRLGEERVLETSVLPHYDQIDYLMLVEQETGEALPIPEEVRAKPMKRLQPLPAVPGAEWHSLALPRMLHWLRFVQVSDTALEFYQVGAKWLSIPCANV